MLLESFWEVASVLNFLYWWIMALTHRDSLESQRLRNSFATLSRLIDVSDFVSLLLLNFFRSQHDVLLFYFCVSRFIRSGCGW